MEFMGVGVGLLAFPELLDLRRADFEILLGGPSATAMFMERGWADVGGQIILLLFSRHMLLSTGACRSCFGGLLLFRLALFLPLFQFALATPSQRTSRTGAIRGYMNCTYLTRSPVTSSRCRLAICSSVDSAMVACCRLSCVFVE